MRIINCVKRLLGVLAFGVFVWNVQAQVVTNPDIQRTGMAHNDDYTVRVRVPDEEWQDLFEYNVQVDMDKIQDASMVQFDMNGKVEVMVKRITEISGMFPYVHIIIR